MKRAGDGALLALVAAAGAGTMVVELAAVRLIAPWYGTSAVVWTNVIGVVLLALAVGYLIGARLSAGPRPLQRLGTVLVLAATIVAWLPFLAPHVASWFLPEGTTLDRAMLQIRWGSLATSMLLFLPAALALGAVGPLAVEVDQRRRGTWAGDAGGRVLAASTLGSLAGTFGTTHLFVPVIGLRATFLLAAAVLGGLGLVVVWTGGRSARTTAALLLALGAGSALTPRAWAEVPPDATLLASRQSPYQTVRVVERVADGERVRELQVNEGFDSFQSVWKPEPGFLGRGYYYDLFALPPWLDERRDGAWRTLVIGLGAGTAWRVLEGELPGALELDAAGVELDPVVVELGRAWMDLPAEGTPGRLALDGWDGRAALHVLDGGWDEIVLDAYANQVEIPPHLASIEFFREVERALRPGGWLAVNVGGFGHEDPVVRAVSRTVAAAFEQSVAEVRVPFARNVILIARRDANPLPDLLPDALPRGWKEWLQLEAATRVSDDASDPLTDDTSEVELLQRASLRRAAEERGR